MTNLLEIEILDNDQGGHKDLLFNIPDLTGPLKFDTYYFALAIEPNNGLSKIKQAIGQLINFWNQKIKKLENGNTIYLPIDFSDQYTGCLKVEKNKNLKLTYGHSRREGWKVNPINPYDYFNSINDFKSDFKKSITVNEDDFSNCLRNIIVELEK